MCTLYERIQSLCKEKGVSGSRMCLDVGLSKSTLSDIKNGRKKGVSTATAQKIASYLDVSVGYLLGEEDIKKEQTIDFGGLSVKQKAVIQKVMQMSDAELDKFDQILALVENTK